MKAKYETVRARAGECADGTINPRVDPYAGSIPVRIIRERDWRKQQAYIRELEATIKDHEPEWKP